MTTNKGKRKAGGAGIRTRQINDAVRQTLNGNDALLSAWRLVEVEFRENKVILRMPETSLFDDLYQVISPALLALKYDLSRGSRWYTVSELDEVLGDITWLWPLWLPVGFVTLLAGDPGAGKSLIALDWLRIATAPDKWPLSNEGPKSSGLGCWVETESSQQLLNIRCKSLGVDKSRILLPGFHADILGQPDMMDSEDQERLVNLIKHNRPALVVIDSLGGAHTRGENKIEEVRPMLSFLADLARDEKVAILAVHHLRKRNSNEDYNIALEHIRGSTAFSAFARVVIAFERNIADDRTLRVIKSNLGPLPEPIAVQVNHDKHNNPTNIEYAQWQPPKGKRNKKEQAADWVLQYLREHGKTRFIELATVAGPMGYSRNMLYAAREELAGAIEITGDGKTSYWELAKNPLLSKGT